MFFCLQANRNQGATIWYTDERGAHTVNTAFHHPKHAPIDCVRVSLFSSLFVVSLVLHTVHVQYTFCKLYTCQVETKIYGKKMGVRISTECCAHGAVRSSALGEVVIWTSDKHRGRRVNHKQKKGNNTAHYISETAIETTRWANHSSRFAFAGGWLLQKKRSIPVVFLPYVAQNSMTKNKENIV